MPYPGEHACRLRDPDLFDSDSFRRIERERESDGKKYSVILGKLKGEDALTEQAYRYPKESWTTAEARKHCQDHDGKSFEPAEEKKEGSIRRPQAIYNRPLAVMPERVKEFMAASEDVFDDLDNQDRVRYKIVNGVALVKVFGFVEERPGLFSMWYCGFSTDALAETLKVLASQRDVDKIVLQVDSPGGHVQGVKTISDLVFSLREKKQIVVAVDSLAASAAYWIASAASRIYLSSKTAMAGSIGVLALHADVSEMEKSIGLKITEITAGRYKAAGSPHKPLTEESQKILQAEVDDIYSIFVDDIARNRNISTEQAKLLADGRIHIGQKAIDLGLADEIISLDDIISKKVFGKGVRMDMITAEMITAEYLATNCPKLLDSIKKDAFESGKKVGIEEERTRIKGIKEIAIEGFESLSQKAIEEGTSPEAFAVLQAKEIKNRGGFTLAAIRQGAQNIPATPRSGEDDQSDKQEEQNFIKSAIAAANQGKKEI